MAAAKKNVKQMSIRLPPSDWVLIQREAARQDIPMSDLVLHWIKEDLEQLRGRD